MFQSHGYKLDLYTMERGPNIERQNVVANQHLPNQGRLFQPPYFSPQY